jgi:hypothetical protein
MYLLFHFNREYSRVLSNGLGGIESKKMNKRSGYMAMIALYSNKIAQMSGLLGRQRKQLVITNQNYFH